MQTIQLELSIDETNLVLEALGQQPYIKIHHLISKIQQQASTQIEAEQPKKQPKN